MTAVSTITITVVSTISTTMTKEAVDLGNEIFSDTELFFSQAHCFQNAISDSQTFIWEQLTKRVIYLQLEVAFNYVDSSFIRFVA